MKTEAIHQPLISSKISQPILTQEEESTTDTNNNKSCSVISPDTGIIRAVSNHEEGDLMKNQVVKDRWVCDVCREATFDDFDEACRHEELCGEKQKQEEVAKESVTVAEKVEVKQQVAVNFEDTPLHPKKLTFLQSNAEMSKAETKTVIDTKEVESTEPLIHDCKFGNDCEICMTETTKKEKKDMKKTKAKAEVIELISSPEVQVVEAKGPFAKSKLKKKTNVNAPTASIFLKKKTVVKAKNDTMKPKKAAKNKNDKTPRTMAFASIFQKGKKTTNTTTTVKANENSPSLLSEQEQKAMLAEHRAAEFASKRKKQLQQEKERQKKRDEIRKKQYEARLQEKEEVKRKQKGLNGQSNVIVLDGRGMDKENIAKTNARSDSTGSKKVKVTVAVEVTERDLRKYPPFFPSPSLVTSQKDTPCKEKLQSISENQYNNLVASQRSLIGFDSVSASPVSDYTETLVDQDSCANENDFLFQTFSSVFRPFDTSNSLPSSQQWCEKYAIKSIPHDVHGDVNKEVATDLVEFINEWKDHRQQLCEARAERAAKFRGSIKKKRRKKTQYHDDDDLWSDDEDSGLKSVYVISGETGTGKTSMAYAAAKHCQCTLIEINTSADRGGKALKKEIEECTQSLSNLSGLKSDDNMFGGVLKEDDDETSSGPSLAVILIDEVDLIFESDGDNGFWQTLGTVSKKAKCPIILTATNLPTQLEKSQTIRYNLSTLIRPTPLECCSKMTQVSKMEGLQWNDGQDQDEIKRGLENIARLCNCDLRRIMNEMQLFAIGKSCSNQEKKVNNVTNESWISCTPLECHAPRVHDIEPQSVPSHKFTVVTIQGEFFLGDNVEVRLGDQVLKSKVVDSKTIITVVPPCKVPSNVKPNGYMKNNRGFLEESLSTMYKRIQVTTTSKSGFSLSSEGLFNTEAMDLPVYLHYSFPYDDDFSDDEMPSTDDVNLDEMLEKALTEVSALEETSTYQEITTEKPSQDCQNQMDSLFKTMADMSDYALLQESHDNFELPCFEGGIHNCTPTQMSREISSRCGWEHESVLGGLSECFVTIPFTRRERTLISNEAHFSKQQKETFEQSASNQATEEDEDEETDDMFFYKPNSTESFHGNTMKSALNQYFQQGVEKYEDTLQTSSNMDCLEFDISYKKDAIPYYANDLIHHPRL